MGLNLAKAKQDLENRDNKEFKPITPGRYEMEIEQASAVTKNDKEAIEVTLRIAEGDFKNRKVWHNLFLTEDAQPYLVRFVEASGNEDLTSKEDVEVSDICKAVVGTTVSGYVKNRTYKGKTYSNVENFQPSGGEGTMKPSAQNGPSTEAPNKKKNLFK